ncbi:hypothetical protein [Streptomyces purpurascens]|uniref:hypothetical protein n=1 Tax=Streptomyces purpurascens TaxID=1924 RepID=UPI001677AC47|nr:hypothetical protein [Streptomyces purpurascens]MCE7050621.1 hypothetical protein [Streptomyces purpurascens]
MLIDGLPGNGRRTAALMLLHELPESSGTLHELPDTSDDRTSEPLDSRDIGSADRLLLDLAEVEESQYVAVQNALPAFREAVIRRGAHLAVILPHHLGYLLRSDLRHLTSEIGRPLARRVLTRHLRREDITPSPDELNSPELTAYLTRAPMRDVAALSDRIRRCRDTSPADRGFANWLDKALEGQRDQATRVAADLATAESGRHRALLLSLAMFHEATPEVVLQTANALLGVLSHPPDTTPRLDRADLHMELASIGADTHQDGRVRFRVAGYDRAVREHFWTFLPDIRSRLRSWFRDCVADPVAGQSVRAEAIARYAEQSLRASRPEDLAWLAEQWTSSGAPPRLVSESAQLLALGLDDDHHGRFFRQRIYDWCTSSETGDRLRRVLILVCSQTMVRSHPDQALVRLHHLARRSKAALGADARGAVLSLARTDDRLYRQMLDRLSTGIARGHWPVDLALFLELAEPTRLISYRSVRESLVTGWSGALRQPVRTWRTQVELWLTAAGSVPHRTLIADVLAIAGAADSQACGLLYRAALDWQHAGPGPDRADTVVCLLHQINAAQGIQPYHVV